jgi:hypothetical protein
MAPPSRRNSKSHEHRGTVILPLPSFSTVPLLPLLRALGELC